MIFEPGYRDLVIHLVAAEFANHDSRTERTVIAQRTRIDIGHTYAPRPRTVKVHRDSARFIISEAGWATVLLRAVDHTIRIEYQFV